jgi:hypothetical protein
MTTDGLPDEKDVIAPQQETDGGVEVEVVNDTPPADRNREPLPQEVVKALEDDDLTEYSDKVKKRLSQMKKVWHDERREKEQASREREEAISFAKHKDAEVRELRAQLGRGEKIFVTEVSKAVTAEISTAKEKMKKAYEAGDADMLSDAQEELTDAKLRLRDLQVMRPALQDEKTDVQASSEQTQPQRQAVPDPKAQAWRGKNTWFGVDEEMTSLALGLHEKLVRSGTDPRSDEYYEKVDSTIKRRFPEYFDGVEESEPPVKTTAQEKPVSRQKSVVAPASRTTAPTRIRLTQSQLTLATRLNLTPEAYAKEVYKLESNNG